MKRLLCVLSCMNAGGAETFLMKIYRTIDRTKYQMDFCINVKEKGFYDYEIEAMGGKIYRIPSKSESLSEFSRQLFHVIKDNDYQYVLRITSSAMGFLDLMIAKKAGAKVCAARSSNSSDGAGLVAYFAHRIGRVLFNRYVDVKIAPSDLAAKYTFGNKAYEKGKVNIVHNAVDLSKYRYDVNGRKAIRSELGISDETKVYGHVGRFAEQKNHVFLLEIFKHIQEKEKDSLLVLVGKGELQEIIRNKAIEMGIEEKIMFLGVRSDVPQILSAMDVFVFPSLYEGMPNTVIEAQATGLPCVISDTITKEANITNLVSYLPLQVPEIWAEHAMAACSKEREDTTQKFVEAKYDIDGVALEFMKLVTEE